MTKKSRRLLVFVSVIVLLSFALTACAAAPSNSQLVTTTITEHTYKDKNNVLPRVVDPPPDNLTKSLNLPKEVVWNLEVAGNCTCFALKKNSRGDLLPEREVKCSDWKAGVAQQFSVYGDNTCSLTFHIPPYSVTSTK